MPVYILVYNLGVFSLPEFLVIMADGCFKNQSIASRIKAFSFLNQFRALRSPLEAFRSVRIDLAEVLKS